MDIVEYAQKQRETRTQIEPDINKTIDLFCEQVAEGTKTDIPAAFSVDTNILVNAAEILKKDRWTPIEEGLPELPEIKGSCVLDWVTVIVTDNYGQTFPLMYCRERVRNEIVCRWRYDLACLYHGGVVAWRYMPEAWKGGKT